MPWNCPAKGFPESPFAFIRLVVRGRYRYWLLALVAGESSNAACGILLPYALNRIITAITTQPRRTLAGPGRADCAARIVRRAELR